MSVDTRDPFRLDLEFEPTSSIRDVILTMEPLPSLLELYVHGITQGGERTVSANVGGHVVLYRTLVTPKQHAELLVRVDEYNADPVAGWKELRARLAAEHLGMLDIPDAGERNPFTLLRFDELALFDVPPPVNRLRHEKTHQGHIVEMPRVEHFGHSCLYAGPEDPSADVELFNRAPETGFAFLWASAIAERAERRRVELEALAAAQVRDLVDIATSLRLGRASA